MKKKSLVIGSIMISSLLFVSCSNKDSDGFPKCGDESYMKKNNELWNDISKELIPYYVHRGYIDGKQGTYYLHYRDPISEEEAKKLQNGVYKFKLKSAVVVDTNKDRTRRTCKVTYSFWGNYPKNKGVYLRDDFFEFVYNKTESGDIEVEY